MSNRQEGHAEAESLGEMLSRMENSSGIVNETLAERSRREAYEESKTAGAERRQDAALRRILKRKPPASLGGAMEAVKMARKPRMRVVEQYLCDQCDKVIQDENDGLVIHGNIYTANPNPARVGGLIGNNFPEGPGEGPATEQVRKTVMCKPCFIKAIGLFDGGLSGLSAPAPKLYDPETSVARRKPSRNVGQDTRRSIADFLEEPAGESPAPPRNRYSGILGRYSRGDGGHVAPEPPSAAEVDRLFDDVTASMAGARSPI